MEPIPQSLQALSELSDVAGVDLLQPLRQASLRLTQVVPSCIGFTLSGIGEEFSITMAAADDLVAALDALQYLDGGPCVDAVSRDTVIVNGDLNDPMDEARWGLFARGAAGHGVRSTLSMPLHTHRNVVGSVNVYAAALDAFDGKEEDLALLFGGWAVEAVRNADLAWATRSEAQQLPQLLKDSSTVNQAVGVLMARHGLSPDAALRRMDMSALRAAVDRLIVAKVIILTTPHDA